MVDEGRAAGALDKIRHAHPQTRLEGLVDQMQWFRFPLSMLLLGSGLLGLGALG